MKFLAWEIVGLNPLKSFYQSDMDRQQTESKLTIAVLDFEPRGISQLESQTLTDRFSTEITNTDKAILVARNSIGDDNARTGLYSSRMFF